MGKEQHQNHDEVMYPNPNNLQFYGLYLLIKGYLLLDCGLLEPQVEIMTSQCTMVDSGVFRNMPT